jgi:hypothetical protein
LEQVMERLRAEAKAAGKVRRFETLAALVWGEPQVLACAEIGARLRPSEGAVKVAVLHLPGFSCN